MTHKSKGKTYVHYKLDLCIHQHNPDTFRLQCCNDCFDSSEDKIRNNPFHNIPGSGILVKIWKNKIRRQTVIVFSVWYEGLHFTSHNITYWCVFVFMMIILHVMKKKSVTELQNFFFQKKRTSEADFEFTF